MEKIYGVLTLAIMLCTGCIGDDFVDDRVDPVLRILNPIDSMAVDSFYSFEVLYLNNVGMEVEVEAEWSSSDQSIITINSAGVAMALSPGSAEISVEYSDAGILAMDSNEVGVGERTVKTESTSKNGLVNTTSSYLLKGAFSMELDESNDMIISFGDDYEASTALPGLYIYLSNNPSTISGALELQAVEVFKGAHSYTVSNVGLNDYGYLLYFCKPFNVKVGHGKIED